MNLRTIPGILIGGCFAVLCLSQSVSAQLAGVDYYILRPDGMLYSGTFGVHQGHAIGATGLSPSPGSGSGAAGGLTFSPGGRMYAIGGTTSDSFDTRVVEVDPATAQSTTVATVDSFYATAVTVDSSDIAYVAEGSIGPEVIARYSTTTGQRLGGVDLDAGFTPFDWVLRSDGMLVGHSQHMFYAYDPFSGARIPIGAYSGTSVGISVLGNRAYIAEIMSPGELTVSEVDLYTGEVTMIGVYGGEFGFVNGTIGFALIPNPGTLLPFVMIAIAARRRR